MKLYKLLFFLFIIVGFGNSLVGGVLYYSTALKTAEEGASQTLHVVSESRAEHIETYLESLQGRMTDFSSDGKIKECMDYLNRGATGCTQEELTRHLIVNKLPAVAGLTKVFTLGLDGKILASSKKEDIGLDQRAELYFSAGHENPFIRIVASANEKKIVVSAPVHKQTFDKDISGFLGYVVGEIDMTKLEEIVKDRTGLGETGEVIAGILKNGTRVYLFKRLFEEEMLNKETAFVEIAEPMKQALFGNELVFKNTFDYRDKAVIASSQYISMADLGLVAKIDRSEIIGVYEMALIKSLIVFGLIITAVSLIFGLIIAHFISRPLEELTKGAEIIGKGNLEHTINIKSKDEIGRLAEAFNNMTVKLRELYAGLEQKVKERTAKLAQAKAKDEAILSSIGEGMVVIDEKGKIEAMNSIAQIMLGWKNEEARGKLYQDVVRVENDKGELIAPFEHPVFTALKTGKFITTNLFYVRHDGGRFPAAITVTPMIVDGKIIGTVNIFRDITKEKEIDKAKTEFVSLASHQLKTPLTAVKWDIEILMAEDAGKISSEQKKYLDEIYHENQRMIDLVGALLNVSRIELGVFMVEPEPTDVVALARSILSEQKPLIDEKKLKIEQKFSKSTFIIQADPKLFTIILENLLSNAIKYTPIGGRINLQFSVNEESIEIEVTDTGYGIPRNQQDKVFTKLFRADNVKEKDIDGTGLGLYVVKSIVDHSGGKIWFESLEGNGTTFYVSLPVEGMKKKEGTKPLL